MHEFTHKAGRSREQDSSALRRRSHAGLPLEPHTRVFFENRFGHDFGKVRVHADGGAAKSSAALGASAYTLGAEIVFGDGEYRPETPRGRYLLAHELAHVVQQDGTTLSEATPEVGNPSDHAEVEADAAAQSVLGPNAAARVSALSSSSSKPVLRKKPVTSWGGKFDNPVYELCSDKACTKNKEDGSRSYGVNMAITFTPNDSVNAEKIALVQTAQTLVDNQAQVVSGDYDVAVSRMVDPTGAEGATQGPGLHIDALPPYRTPLAGMADPDKGSKSLAESTPGETSENVKGYKAQFGWHSTKKSPKTQAAVFSDIPRYGAKKSEEASQVFETTALAVEGPHEGAYFGSVRWGWTKKSSEEKATLIEFQAASHGISGKAESVAKQAAPSPAFFEAVEKWNQSKNTAGEPSIPLPGFADKFIKNKADLVDDKGKSLGKLDVNTQVGSDGTKRQDWTKVVVISGAQTGKAGWAQTGKVGWVKTDNLSDRETEVKQKK
jgi:hypothetical protein